MKSTIRLLNDVSTLANFVNWASGVSSQLAAMGMVQTNDTGQVAWTDSVCVITSAVATGGVTLYHYSSITGPALRVNMVITVAGMSSANNCTALIVSIGSGTFTVNNAGLTESVAGTGTIDALEAMPTTTGTTTHKIINDASTPNTINWQGIWRSGADYALDDTITYQGNTFQCISASGSGTNAPPTGATPANTWWSVFHYEVWTSNDGLTPYFVRMEYGVVGSIAPTIAFQIGSVTNGSGAMTGSLLSQRETGNFGGSTGGASIYSECDFFGAGSGGTSAGLTGNGSAFSMLLWRDSIGGSETILLGWERSQDNNGNYNSNYLTYIFAIGPNNSTTPFVQCSVFLSGGVATGTRDIFLAGLQTGGAATWSGMGSVAVSPIYCLVGWLGNPVTIFTKFRRGDFSEASGFRANLYGTDHSYLALTGAWAEFCEPNSTGALGMRFE